MSNVSISPACHALIKAVYQGPLEVKPWQQFLRLLRDATHSDFATLLLRPPKEGDAGIVLNASVISDEVYSQYNDNYFSLDAFVDLPPGKVLTWHEFMQGKSLEETAYYQQYMAPINVYFILGADLTDSSGMNVRLRLCRSRDQGDFNAQEKAVCQLVLPHLSQALDINSRLQHIETERRVLATAIEQMALGSIVLDDRGLVLRVNAAAQALIDQNSCLSHVDQRLLLKNTDQHQAFTRLLEKAFVAYKSNDCSFVQAFTVRRHAGSSVGLLLRPMPHSISSEGKRKPTVQIFISDPDLRRGAPNQLLDQLFAFTAAESRLALLLANGLTLDEAAAELAVSRNTIKSHLSAIYAKAGVSKQGKLVQLILKSVAALA